MKMVEKMQKTGKMSLIKHEIFFFVPGEPHKE